MHLHGLECKSWSWFSQLLYFTREDTCEETINIETTLKEEKPENHAPLRAERQNHQNHHMEIVGDP